MWNILRLNMCSIVLYLHIDGRCHIFRHLFCIHQCYELLANEECIIRIPVFVKGRIGRPFADGNISPLYRTRSFAVAQVLRISFPTRKTKLLVNQASGLRLIPIHHSGDRFRPLCALLLRFARSGGLDHGQLLRQFLNFPFLLGNNGFQIFVRGLARHNELRRNISPVSIGFHKPNSKIVCQG